jgi:hypothetical protein
MLYSGGYLKARETKRQRGRGKKKIVDKPEQIGM